MISFYPGGGGNRYYNSINNREYETLDRSYDNYSDNIFGNQMKFRYLEDSTRYEFGDEITILTHCLNLEKIKYHFPKKTKFVILDTDFRSSIRRQWCLEGKNIYKKKEKKYSKLEVYNTIKEKSWPAVNNENELKDLPAHLAEALTSGILGDTYYSGSKFDNINSAFSSICYHRNYYDKYPPTMLTEPGIDVVNCKKNNKNLSEFSKIILSELDRYSSEEFEFAWDAFDIGGHSAPILSMWEDFLNQKL